MSGFHAKDLSDHTFDKWTVLRRAPNKPGKVVAWLCRCDPERGGCGAEHAVAAGTLKSGRSKSCSRCAALKRHADNPALSAHLPKLARKTWKGTCKTCGEGFKGTAQRYCAPTCWSPDNQRARGEAERVNGGRVTLRRSGDLSGARAALTEAARRDPRWVAMLKSLPPLPVAPPPRPVENGPK